MKNGLYTLEELKGLLWRGSGRTQTHRGFFKLLDEMPDDVEQIAWIIYGPKEDFR